MTLRIIEGFDFMPTGQSAARNDQLWAAKGYYSYYAGGGGASGSGQVPGVMTGRFDFGNAMLFDINQGASNAYAVHGRVIPSGVSVSEGFCGVAMYRFGNSSPGAGGPFVGLFSMASGAPIFTVSLEEFGIVRVYRGLPNSGTLIVQSYPASFQEDEWLWVDFRGIVDGSAGLVQVRINTVPVAYLPTGNTGAVASDSVLVGCYAPSSLLGFRTHCAFDDLYFCDTAGAANNNFLGNTRVKTQFVSGNASPQDFLIGGSAPAATAWQSLLNKNLDDTKFIYSGTPGDESLFTVEAIINSPTIFGLQLSGAYRQDDATQRVVANRFKSGASAAQGTDKYINQSSTFYRDIFETSPATGVGFTGAELNALLVGPKEVS